MITWNKINHFFYSHYIEPFDLVVQQDPYSWCWSINVNGKCIWSHDNYRTSEEAQSECIAFVRRMANNLLQETNEEFS